MSSPFRRHKQKTLATLAAIAAGQGADEGAAPEMPEDGPQSAEYQTLLAQLHGDLQTLGSTQSTEAKIATKRDLIANYIPWCVGALEIPEGAAAPQDEIVIHTLIWALDVQNWPLALDLGEHVITHSLRLPERFHRGPAALLASEIADAAVATPGSVPHDILERALPYIDPPHDMRDNTRAKLHRAIGESWARQAAEFNPEAETAAAGGQPSLLAAAIEHMKRALELDDNVGVKSVLRDLEREAKKLADAAAAKGD